MIPEERPRPHHTLLSWVIAGYGGLALLAVSVLALFTSGRSGGVRQVAEWIWGRTGPNPMPSLFARLRRYIFGRPTLRDETVDTYVRALAAMGEGRVTDVALMVPTGFTRARAARALTGASIRLGGTLEPLAQEPNRYAFPDSIRAAVPLRVASVRLAQEEAIDHAVHADYWLRWLFAFDSVFAVAVGAVAVGLGGAAAWPAVVLGSAIPLGAVAWAVWHRASRATPQGAAPRRARVRTSILVHLAVRGREYHFPGSEAEVFGVDFETTVSVSDVRSVLESLTEDLGVERTEHGAVWVYRWTRARLNPAWFQLT